MSSEVPFVYSTDSDEHLENIGEKSVPQWDELTDIELSEDIQAVNDYLDDELDHLDQTNDEIDRLNEDLENYEDYDIS